MYHCAYIDTVTQNRAVERRASRCWCSTGNPLHCQGSPVSTGCWEVLGYWVCLSSDRSRQLQKQAIVIFACVLQDRVLKGSHFLFSCLHFFPLFLRLCTSWSMKYFFCQKSEADTVGPSHLGLWKLTVQWARFEQDTNIKQGKYSIHKKAPQPPVCSFRW